jgi:two-component system, response regulator PdtaR
MSHASGCVDRSHLATILVVEDEVLIRLLIAYELRLLGHVVWEAGSGDEALKFLQSDPGIDLVFSDIQMPGTTSGIALAGVISDKYPKTAIVLTSGRPEIFNLPEACDFIPKPYRALDVAHQISHIATIGE